VVFSPELTPPFFIIQLLSSWSKTGAGLYLFPRVFPGKTGKSYLYGELTALLLLELPHACIVVKQYK